MRRALARKEENFFRQFSQMEAAVMRANSQMEFLLSAMHGGGMM
jgi:flagellar capping protein FliD